MLASGLRIYVLVVYIHSMRYVRPIVLFVGCAGAIVFGALFLLSVISPIHIERAAKEIIRYQVSKRVSEKFDALDSSALVQKAKALIPGLEARIERGRGKLDERVSAALDAAFANMQNPSCECRRFMKSLVRSQLESDASVAELTRSRLAEFIQSKYGDVATKLLREFRIFTGSSAVLFALLALIPLVRRNATVQLLPVTIVLLLGFAVSAWFYLFAQDWLNTILFGKYVGWAFAGWLAFSVLLLSDLLLNRARMTVNVISRIGFDVVSPC